MIRKSNIELCRIVAILCVMLIHSTFQSLGKDVSFGVMLLAGFSIIGGLISGHATAQRDSRLFVMSYGTCKTVYYVGSFLLFFIPGLSLKEAVWLQS